ncbi:MAG: ribosome silencing factor [Candidatus Dormibacteraeota bacterium]|nr:ribosome silencing factor [Candidatus Dormibacteraeota bacterium]
MDSRELAELLRGAAEDRKAWDPVIMDLRGLTTIADYFVICEGETDRQVKAIADAMVERARERRVRPLAVDGYEDATWVLLDFDSVLAHVFLPGERSYYDLEGLWRRGSRAREEADMPGEGEAQDVEDLDRRSTAAGS